MSKKSRKSVINIFYVPAILLFLFFVIYPFAEGIRISFTNWNGYSQKYTYVKFDNYVKLLHDGNILTALKNTLIYGIGSTVVQNILGLGYAVLLNTKMKGRTVIRTVVYAPVMISGLVMGYIMYFLVQYDGGAVNDILAALGQAPVDWLSSGSRAVIIMTLINSIQYVGISMVIYLAGLQNISSQYYEAAAIDGVSRWQQFRYITVPLLIPAISSSVTLNLIGGLKLFDVIQALTKGGPGYASHSLSTLVANQYFQATNAGYSSTIGLFSFLLIMLLSNVVTSYFNKKEVYM
ncbi:sugar ABC transporter permease [Blautia pseudococcoides]|uniref:carbohydrate ABC transporter permease n=1 Tax=Blautia pseudococcoides TaxID=1796616 RepID=UPI00148B2B41|nr:sugar ABC transporter permease [Blautia pseudococcoides]QJU17503.1 sugar ABC transporter permease [Blautia pseudococcoides]